MRKLLLMKRIEVVRRTFLSAPPVIAMLVVLGASILLLIFSCWWYNVWSLDGWTVYREMDRECHPAWREYHFGRVRKGDSVDQVIARTQPPLVERRGRWTFLRYQRRGFTGMWAAAYDGQMVYATARSCCWVRVFFDELTDAQSLELDNRTNAEANAELNEQSRRMGIIVVRNPEWSPGDDSQ